MDETRKSKARAWFETLRDRIMADFETLEDDAPASLYPGAAGRFEKTVWSRARGENGENQGGGVMGMMRGRLFEKVGVHTSTVFGQLSPEFAKQVKGAETERMFWASGVSLIAHMKNPRVPAVHLNTRMIVTTESWFGGGADLNPTLDAARTQDHPDAARFHAAMKAACGDPGRYEEYRKWADDYFWLPHRGEPRGVGGIFYDHHQSGDWESDFAFTQGVGEAFRAVYPKIVRGRMGEAWTDAERHEQAKWRGRYVEFNLLYDRGTMFGLKTGGNVESILSSMPPIAEWK